MQYYTQLLNSIKRGVVSPVYLFYGEEAYLRGKIIDHFKEGLLDQAADFNFEVLDGEQCTVADVISMASTPPFMAGKRLVVVKNPPWFGGKNDRDGGNKNDHDIQQILDYIHNPLTSTCLIFNCATVDRRKKIVKSIEKAGTVVNFTKLKARDLAIWLDDQASKKHKKLEYQAKEILINSTASGLTGLVSEWEKILTYIGEQQIITAADIQPLVHQSAEYRIFDVLDAIGSRQYSSALLVVKELLANKEPPQVILTMVARQFRLMLQVKELYKRGLTPAEMSRYLDEKLYPVKKAVGLSKNFTSEQLLRTLNQLAQLDVDVKTGHQEFYPGLEILLFNLALEQR